jgi:hypothetical protein
MSHKKRNKKMKTASILKACEKSYTQSGVQGAIDTATKHKVKVYAHCSPCDAEQPSIAGWCCVCGSHNK